MKIECTGRMPSGYTTNVPDDGPTTLGLDLLLFSDRGDLLRGLLGQTVKVTIETITHENDPVGCGSPRCAICNP